jgi:hypothetical protein
MVSALKHERSELFTYLQLFADLDTETSGNQCLDRQKPRNSGGGGEN